MSSDNLLISFGPEIRLGVDINRLLSIFFKLNGGVSLYMLNRNNEGYETTFVPVFFGSLGLSFHIIPLFRISIAANYPLVVYSDAADGILRLARSNNTSPYGNANWSVQTIMSDTVDEDNFGLARDYYSAQVDASGFLHIIFRNSRGELGYIVSTNNPENGAAYTFGTSVTLDEYGLWADLTLKGTTPYISYLSKVNAYDGIKIAFYDNNLDLDGDDTPEGGWETMTAAMDQKSSNIRTSVEAHPNGTGTNWTAAVGYTPDSEYRVVYYIGE